MLAKDSRLDPGGEELLERVRAICLDARGHRERRGWQSIVARAGKIFAMRHDAHAGPWGIRCKAPAGAQRALVEGEADRFFLPPYVGVHRWIGLSRD